MIVIVEIRCEPSKLERVFHKLGFNGFLATDNQGYAGGTIVAWIEEVMKVTLITKKIQFMHIYMEPRHGKAWYFTHVYASPNCDNR